MADRQDDYRYQANRQSERQDNQSNAGGRYGDRQPAFRQGSSQQRGSQRTAQQNAAQQRGSQQRVSRQGASQQASNYRHVDYRQQGGQHTRALDASQYSSSNVRYFNLEKKKRHTGRNIAIVVLVLIILVGACAGYTGYTLYNSAKVVKSEASAVMSDIDSLKDQIMNEQFDAAKATAQSIAKRSANMKAETSGWSWKVAKFVPKYGGDIAKVRELSNILDDLSTNAIVPLVNEVTQVSLKNLLNDGAINVELAQRLVNALNSAAPVISRSAEKVNLMGDAVLDQVNGPLTKARTTLGKLNSVTQFVASIAPTFADLLGANGQPRTYLIVAQNNSEIRSTGGFLGSIGPLYLDNGAIELGDFRSIYDIYPSMYNGAPLTDEELDIFGYHVGWQIADSNFIPDFSRVGEIVKYAWEEKGYGYVDGVIGVDPVFLQDMLAIAGGITTSNGTVVDGTNAARLLLHESYYMDPEEQDPFFEEVASLAFKQLMGNLGEISLTDFADKLSAEIEVRRVQAWMVEPNEQEAMEFLGCDGELPHDAAEPTLGVYFIDESYSKLFWYLNVATEVGEGTRNEDGSTTYPVSVTYWNMLQDIGELSEYMSAQNSLARSPGEMIAWLMLSAPEGGYISDFSLDAGEFMPASTPWRDDGSILTGWMTEGTLQGLDFWYGLTRTLPGDAFSISFYVTTSPEATQPLKVIRTPDAQEVAGW